MQGAGGGENVAEREVYLTREREGGRKKWEVGGWKAARNARTETAAGRVLNVVDQLNP